MPVEVECSRCEGRMMAEPGAVVSCPHCGSHLTVPEDAAETAIANCKFAIDNLQFSGSAVLCASGVPAVVPPPEESSEAGSERSTALNSDYDAVAASAGAPTSNGDIVTAASLDQATGPDVVPKLWFVMALSYASAVTIALILVTLWSMGAQPNALESLPDLKPPQKDGKIALRLVSEDAPMPPGHTLRLGEARRFGNVLVQPLRVTRGPVQFAHFSHDDSRTRPPTGDVLKLWLRFTNVADAETLAPLDRELMLTRVYDEASGQVRANNFVCRVADKRQDGDRVMIYDISKTSDWELKGQHIGQTLQPGESFVTYVASQEEGIEQLQGELIWRVHFRKGYNPDSLRGVTTLVEVAFSSDDIQPETG